MIDLAVKMNLHGVWWIVTSPERAGESVAAIWTSLLPWPWPLLLVVHPHGPCAVLQCAWSSKAPVDGRKQGEDPSLVAGGA